MAIARDQHDSARLRLADQFQEASSFQGQVGPGLEAVILRHGDQVLFVVVGPAYQERLGDEFAFVSLGELEHTLHKRGQPELPLRAVYQAPGALAHGVHFEAHQVSFVQVPLDAGVVD